MKSIILILIALCFTGCASTPPQPSINIDVVELAKALAEELEIQEKTRKANQAWHEAELERKLKALEEAYYEQAK